MDPELKESARQLYKGGNSAKFVLIDGTVEKNKDIIQQEGIEGYPTMILYKEGRRLGEHLGERKHRYVFSVLTFDELKKS
jgi:hypothetical protein